MKKVLLFVLLSLYLCKCKNINDSISSSTSNNHNNEPQNLKNNVSVKDKSLYDKSFLDGLADYPEHITLVGNYIVTGKDTTYFPTDIPLKVHMLLKGKKNEKAFILSISRVNYTNLEYAFQVIGRDGKTVFNRNGKSVLTSTFFLASEMDEDIELDDTYGSYEYWDYSDSCTLSIRFGIGKDEKGRNRATITYGCKDKTIGNLNLDDCPILRTEKLTVL